MSLPEVNGWAVLLATLSTMVVSSLWYSPRLLGAAWMARAHVTRDAAASRGSWPMIVTVLVGVVTATVLAGATVIVHAWTDGAFLADALLTGTALWGGFTAARLVTHDAFEGRPASLTLINLGNELVTVVVMSLVIGLLGP
jgi:hypothetical protein